MNCNPIIPAYTQNNIPIVLQSSNYFAPYASVTIQSIINHASPDKNYDIIVTSINMLRETREKLVDMAYEYPNISIRVINVGRYHQIYQPKGNARVGSESSTRIFLGDILEEYSKVLNVDSDMIVMTDIAKAYEVDVSDAYIAAATDALMYFFYHTNAEDGAFKTLVDEVIGLPSVDDYFNCGFMVMNLEKIRKEVYPDEIINFDKGSGCRFAEQDPINYFMQNGRKKLDFSWNYCVDPTWAMDFSIEEVPDRIIKEYIQAKKSPNIVHFVTWKKPWQFYGVEYSEEFWRIAKTSPFYETIKKRNVEFIKTHLQKYNEEKRNDKKQRRIAESQIKARLKKMAQGI